MIACGREESCARVKGADACGVYLPDLEQPKPPDLPPGLVKLRVVKESKSA